MSAIYSLALSKSAGKINLRLDQFGVPVHAIGVGEGIRDLRPFAARDYACSLMGINAD